jgi:hypothetical protein
MRNIPFDQALRGQLAAATLFVAAALPTFFPQAAAAGAKGNEVAEQRKAALVNWKRAFPKDESPPALETTHLLIFGRVPGKDLKEIAPTLEKQFDTAREALALDPKDLWPGKLTVFLVPDAKDYAAFIRRVEKRYPEEGELGSASVRKDPPHVVGGPPRLAVDLAVEAEAGAQIANALLQKKFGTVIPSWVRTGFGRATVTQTAAKAARAAEHRRVLSAISKKKRKAKDAWGPLDDDEASLIRGSVIEYLAYSGRTKKFLPFLEGFRPTEQRPEPTAEDALKATEIAPERLHLLWLKWLRAPA